MKEVLLTNDKLQFGCLPESGGSISNLKIRRGDAWIPVMRETKLPLNSPGDVASFNMGPWVGRVLNGQARIHRRVLNLPRPDKHSIHGLVRDVPWNLSESKSDRVVLTLDSDRNESTRSYPFPFFVTLTYSITESSLATSVRFENRAREIQPAGWGFHPYFPASLAGFSSRAKLTTRFTGMFVGGEVPIPTTPPIPVPPDFDFSSCASLREGFDTCFSGWSGMATLFWEDAGVSVTIKGSALMQYLVLFSPPGKPFVAVEPMSIPPNAFNLEADSVMPTNLQWLEPGQSFEAGYETLFSEA